MIDALLLTALAQSQPATISQTCALLAPAGEAIVMTVAPGVGGATLIPAEGSAWPLAPASAVRPDRVRDGEHRYVAGGRGGVVLDVQPPSNGRRATAMLSRWSGSRGDMPLAFGFCVPGEAARAPTGAARPVATDIPAFNPNRWPSDCALLLGDGRRLRVDYRVETPTLAVTIESPNLWGGRAVSGRVRRGNAGEGVFATTDNGPRGTELTVLNNEGRTATRLLQFVSIGDAASPSLPGYAICGYNRLARGPAPR